jgi:hypothetical protein
MWRAALATLLLSGCCLAPPEPIFPIEAITNLELFNYVCTELEAIAPLKNGEPQKNLCKDVRPPIVVRSHIVDYIGYSGVTWDGEEYVFVGKVNPVNPSKTLVHEMVHYVSLIKGWNKDVCSQEELARRIADKWTGEEPDESWRSNYRCPPK